MNLSASSPTVLFRRAKLPSGSSGSFTTVAMMRDLAREGAKRFAVWKTARKLVEPLVPYDRLGELEALHEFVRDEIRYTRDPLGVESLQAPEHTLSIRTGDCDDKVTLLGALAQTIGFPVRYVLLATNPRRPGQFTHVYLESHDGMRWIPMETILPRVALGWIPPGFRRERVSG